ncbi:hypothetical protein ACA910_014899 [Epithemia clementina (nom. ined.)]
MFVQIFLLCTSCQLIATVAFHPRTFRATPRIASHLQSIPNAFDTLTSGLASICRLPRGVTVDSCLQPNPNIRLLKLYDIENSRACRAVREIITEFDLVIDKVIPAAEDSRAMVEKSYEDFLPPGVEAPCLVVSLADGKIETFLGESTILTFLNQTYRGQAVIDNKETPSELLVEGALQLLQAAGNYAASLLRTGRGCRVSTVVTASLLSSKPNRPQKPLILYSYEGNQFCRLVREVLTELDLVYELRSTGKGSVRRSELAELTGGSTQCPYLVDPNSGVAMAESADIIAYLYDKYALWTPPSELLEWSSNVITSNLKPIFTFLAPVQAGSKSLEEEVYKTALDKAVAEIETETKSSRVVVYTYAWSPFSIETKKLLDGLKVEYKEISLGQEWIPGLIASGGALKRAALQQMTGQSSLPHIFVGAKAIGGLFSGNPGLVPALTEGKFLEM